MAVILWARFSRVVSGLDQDGFTGCGKKRKTVILNAEFARRIPLGSFVFNREDSSPRSARQRSTISATCLAAGSSTDQFSHRLESSTLSGCTVRFRKPRRRPCLRAAALSARNQSWAIRIHDSCWSPFIADGFRSSGWPRIVRKRRPESGTRFRVGDSAGTHRGN